jgi:hypothetical protein
MFERTSLAVDAQGAVSAATANPSWLLSWSSSGKEAPALRVGTTPTVSGVIGLNDGTRLVVDALGMATGVSPSGAIAFSTDLELSDRHARVTVSPAENGGAWISAGTDVVMLDPSGSPSRHWHLSEPTVGGVLTTRRGALVATQSGALHLLLDTSEMLIGQVAGDAGEAGFTTVDGETIYAVLDSRALIAFDVATRTLQVRLTVADQSLHGPVSFLPNGTVAAVTYTGELVRVRASGEELPRVSLEHRTATLLTDAGRVNFAALDESPRVVTDVDGRLAFARVGGAIGVIAEGGQPFLASGGDCASPAALAPAGRGRFAVACRNGDILLFGEGGT